MNPPGLLGYLTVKFTRNNLGQNFRE
jgi:hypothetical protein